MLEFNWGLLFTVIDLLILYVLLRKFLFGRVDAVIKERQKEAEADFQKAQEEQDKARQLQKQYEDSLQGIEEQRKQVLDKSHREAAAEYDRLIKNAGDEAKEIREQARNAALAEKNRVLQEAQSEIASLVVTATAKVIGAKPDQKTDAALYDEFIGKVGDSLDKDRS